MSGAWYWYFLKVRGWSVKSESAFKCNMWSKRDRNIEKCYHWSWNSAHDLAKTRVILKSFSSIIKSAHEKSWPKNHHRPRTQKITHKTLSTKKAPNPHFSSQHQTLTFPTAPLYLGSRSRIDLFIYQDQKY